jgi:hypothetical protein
MALEITTSPDLALDARFDVIVNSVSPEFQSADSDSGINKSCYIMLTGYKGEGDKPPPLAYDKTQFQELNNAPPGYGDELWSKVEPGTAPEGSALKYIVHALAPDMSHRPKRLPSGLTHDEAKAVLVAVYLKTFLSFSNQRALGDMP